MLERISFFDLKKGPIKDVILPDRLEASFNPKILKIKKEIKLSKIE